MSQPQVTVSFDTYSALLKSVGCKVLFVEDEQGREGIRLPDRYSPTRSFDVFPTAQAGAVEAVLSALGALE